MIGTLYENDQFLLEALKYTQVVHDHVIMHHKLHYL